jgi:ABC-type branched-subunit amino acid transport system substrate-binding protein
MKKVLFVTLLALVIGFCGPVSAEVGVSDTEIVIGSHQDLSGPIAGWGIQVKQGMEMRAREINEAGGIHGRKIRLVVEDSGYDPKKAIMVTNKMIQKDKVFCFIGNMGSPTAGASLPIIIKKKIPHLFPLTAASIFFEPFNRYKFALFVPYYSNARAAIKYFVETKKYKRIGMMYQDDEMGAIMKKGVVDGLAAYNLKLVAAESYKRGATDFSSQIAKLKKADVQLVVLGTVIRETVGALKEAHKLGWKVDMCGLIPAFTKFVPMLAKKAGFSADGMYCTGQTPMVEPDSPIAFVRKWWKRHQEWYGKPPQQQTAAGYGVMNAFAIAAERAGRDLTRETLIDALETFREIPDPFGGPPITYTKTKRLGADRIFMSRIQEGKFVKISDFIDYKK